MSDDGYFYCQISFLKDFKSGSSTVKYDVIGLEMMIIVAS